MYGMYMYLCVRIRQLRFWNRLFRIDLKQNVTKTRVNNHKLLKCLRNKTENKLRMHGATNICAINFTKLLPSTRNIITMLYSVL